MIKTRESVHGPCVLLFQLLFLVTKLLEPSMLNCLASRYTIIWVINQELLYKIYRIWADMGHQLRYTSTLSHIGEIKLHVGGVLLEFLQEFFRWGAHDIVNFNYLVELIVTWEQREEGKDLK